VNPLILIGADALRAGRPSSVWDFRHLGATKDQNTGKVVGHLDFELGGRHRRVPLRCAPAAGVTRRVYRQPPDSAAMIASTHRGGAVQAAT
jgi:hypothetical protein